MKILMVTATPFFADRGSHIRIYEEALALQRQGVQVKIVTYPLGYTPDGVTVKRGWGLPWYNRTAVGSSGKGVFDWKIILDLFLIIRTWWELWKYRPDYLYCHGQEALCVALVARVLYLPWIPLVLDAQGSLLAELTSYGTVKAQSLSARLYQIAEELAYGASQYIFVSSPNSESFIKQHYPLYASKVVMVKDSYHSQVRPFSVQEGRAARKALGIPASADVLMYTGSFTASKGLPELWKQLPRILNAHKKLWVVVAGYPGAEELRQQAKELQHGKRIVVVDSPKYQDLPQLLGAATIAIDPKHDTTEASGKSINYMAAGLPIIASDTESNHELIGKDGLYFKTQADLPRLLRLKRKSLYTYQFIREHTWNKSAMTICHYLLRHKLEVGLCRMTSDL